MNLNKPQTAILRYFYKIMKCELFLYPRSLPNVSRKPLGRKLRFRYMLFLMIEYILYLFTQAILTSQIQSVNNIRKKT